jgi:hypothetical protein
MAAASAMKAHGACIGTLALVLMGATSLYADDAPDLEEQIDASMFNAALKKPVIADSYLSAPPVHNHPCIAVRASAVRQPCNHVFTAKFSGWFTRIRVVVLCGESDLTAPL